MTWILSLLGGGFGGWILAGSLLAAAIAGGAGGYEARGIIDAPALAQQQTLTAQANGRTQQCVAEHERGRADGAEQVVADLKAAAGNVTAAAADLEKKAGARDAATNRFLQELANAPKTSVCAGSAAELAYRRSVQPQSGP